MIVLQCGRAMYVPYDRFGPASAVCPDDIIHIVRSKLCKPGLGFSEYLFDLAEDVYKRQGTYKDDDRGL